MPTIPDYLLTSSIAASRLFSAENPSGMKSQHITDGLSDLEWPAMSTLQLGSERNGDECGFYEAENMELDIHLGWCPV